MTHETWLIIDTETGKQITTDTRSSWGSSGAAKGAVITSGRIRNYLRDYGGTFNNQTRYVAKEVSASKVLELEAEINSLKDANAVLEWKLSGKGSVMPNAY